MFQQDFCIYNTFFNRHTQPFSKSQLLPNNNSLILHNDINQPAARYDPNGTVIFPDKLLTLTPFVRLKKFFAVHYPFVAVQEICYVEQLLWRSVHFGFDDLQSPYIIDSHFISLVKFFATVNWGVFINRVNSSITTISLIITPRLNFKIPVKF